MKSGLLDKVKKSLEKTGIAYVELGGVVPNPHITKVYEGIELCKKEGVDFILAVGGGSVIDSAKAIAYGLAYHGDVWDLFEHTAKAEGCYPIGVILTISAAGPNPQKYNTNFLHWWDYQGHECETKLSREPILHLHKLQGYIHKY